MPRPHTLLKTLALSITACALLSGTPARVSADVLHLSGGGRLEGILIEESAARVTLEVSTGRVTLPRSRVLNIERTESALAAFRARLAAAPSESIAALVTLGRFADANGLAAEARQAWTRVLLLDPSNAEAHRALGHVVLAGSWMEPEEAYRAQGLIPFEGRWVTPAEQDATLRARDREHRTEEDRRVEQERRNARESEDRARRAEAELRRAQEDANRRMARSPWGDGAPVVIAGPVWQGGRTPCIRLPCEALDPRATPNPTPMPTPRPVRPSSIR